MKINFKVILLILVILLFLGTIILIAFGNPQANDIINKVP